MNNEESSSKKKLNISPLKIKSKKPKIELSAPISSPSKINRDSKNMITKPNSKKLKRIDIPSVIINNSKKNFIQYSKIKYGIDESGNPMNIKDYYRSINDSVSNTNTSVYSGLTSMTNNRLKRPIAYITQDEKGKNILIDLKGNLITKKNKEGDYDFPLQMHVIIKDFDVKHPELRINGERNYNEILETNREEEINLFDNEIIGNLQKEDFNDLIDKNSNSNNKKQNKFLLRTYDILKFENSPEKNRINTQNNVSNKSFENFKKLKLNKIMNKNKSFVLPMFGKNSYKKFQMSKSRENLNFNDNKKKDIDEINTRLKKIFCLKNNKNDRTKIINKNEKFNINESIKDKNQQKIIQHTVRIIPRKRNNNNDNNKTFNINKNYNKQIENKTNKYFIMKKNKSFINNKSKKVINIKNENNIFQNMNKTKLIQTNKNQNNNIYINLSKTNKIFNKNNLNINNNININNNSYIEEKVKAFGTKFIINKIKQKIYNNEKNKNNEINNYGKYYILSEEADNMIKSYSKKKLMNEKKVGKRNISINNELLYTNNSYNFNYSKFSPINK